MVRLKIFKNRKWITTNLECSNTRHKNNNRRDTDALRLSLSSGLQGYVGFNRRSAVLQMRLRPPGFGGVNGGLNGDGEVWRGLRRDGGCMLR